MRLRLRLGHGLVEGGRVRRLRKRTVARWTRQSRCFPGGAEGRPYAGRRRVGRRRRSLGQRHAIEKHEAWQPAGDLLAIAGPPGEWVAGKRERLQLRQPRQPAQRVGGRDEVAVEVERLEGWEVGQPVEVAEQVATQVEVRQLDERLESVHRVDAVVAQVEFREAVEPVEVLDGRDLVVREVEHMKVAERAADLVDQLG